MSRSAALLLAAAVVGAAGCAHAQAPATAASKPAAASNPACPPAFTFPAGVEIVKVVRVFTNAKGETELEFKELKGESRAFFKPGEMFTTTMLGPAKKVALVSGPPNVEIKLKPSPYKEMFLTLQGTVSVALKDGVQHPLPPGTLTIMEDMGSKDGHAGRIGECGYISLNIVPTDSTGP